MTFPQEVVVGFFVVARRSPSSFDCQENPDDLDSVDPVCTTTSLPGTTRSNRRGVHVVEQFIFFQNSGLKDNDKINTNSTNKNYPTKRLDTVGSTTGRIIDNILTLEINITSIEEDTTGIGHFQHKRQ